MSDEFGTTVEDKTKRESKFRKTEFMRLDEGEHVIRIIEPRETKHFTHYVGWAYLKCLGDECPLCANNKKIMYEHPEDYREVKGWNPRRDRYYINVLDRTVAKKCEKCETVAPNHFDLCPACGSTLPKAEPINKVKVFSGSGKLFEDLKVLSKTVRDENDERVDIRAYDWIVMVRGKSRDKITNVRPNYFPSKAGLLEVTEELYDLSKAVIEVSPEEMLDIFNGTSLKDIFTMRRAKKQVLDNEEITGEDIQAEIESSVNDIFKLG